MKLPKKIYWYYQQELMSEQVNSSMELVEQSELEDILDKGEIVLFDTHTEYTSKGYISKRLAMEAEVKRVDYEIVVLKSHKNSLLRKLKTKKVP